MVHHLRDFLILKKSTAVKAKITSAKLVSFDIAFYLKPSKDRLSKIGSKFVKVCLPANGVLNVMCLADFELI